MAHLVAHCCNARVDGMACQAKNCSAVTACFKRFRVQGDTFKTLGFYRGV